MAFVVVAFVGPDANADDDGGAAVSVGSADEDSGEENVGKGIAGGGASEFSGEGEGESASVGGRFVVSTLRPRPSAVGFFSLASWKLSPPEPEPEPDDDRDSSTSTSAGKANTGPRGFVMLMPLLLLLLVVIVEKAVVRKRRGTPMSGENAAVLACWAEGSIADVEEEEEKKGGRLASLTERDLLCPPTRLV
jgi:hypothetical protein